LAKPNGAAVSRMLARDDYNYAGPGALTGLGASTFADVAAPAMKTRCEEKAAVGTIATNTHVT